MNWFKKLVLPLLSLFCCSFSDASMAYTNIWDVLRQEFTLNHDVSRPEVQAQLQWLVAHPSYLHKLTQSEPYIYHIVSEIRKRHLPGELALLPMIESAYDPFAYSGVGAAGLWQLMPGTGTNLGLKQDWWFDGRRSIRPSTDAALNYLKHLNHFFHGNWILAIAAYDSGEGTVARAVKNSRENPLKASFWRLSLPSETRAYVPRLLALAEIIKYPARYHVMLPDISFTPYFEEVNIGSQIDLNHAAKLAGMPYKELIKLNPGYNHWTTAPYKPFKLLIPTNKVAKFNHNLAEMSEEKRISFTKHLVKRGDTLASIANRYSTTTKLIKSLNQLKSEQLKINHYLVIPDTKNAPRLTTHKAPMMLVNKPPSYHTYKVLHIVQKSDNYSTLEKKYLVSSSKINEWNKFKKNHQLTPGEQLVIWRSAVTPGSYTIVAGDTLSTIAKRNKTSVDSIKKLNPEINTHLLKPGQLLVVG